MEQKTDFYKNTNRDVLGRKKRTNKTSKTNNKNPMRRFLENTIRWLNNVYDYWRYKKMVEW